jgi:hypothetical protein
LAHQLDSINKTQRHHRQPEKERRMTIDRSEVSRALSKAIAYKNVGKDKEAEEWARRLVELLECAKILK